MTAALAGAGLALTVAIAFAIFIKLFGIGLLGRAERRVPQIAITTSVAVGVLDRSSWRWRPEADLADPSRTPLCTFDSDAPSKMADGWLLVL